jgi:hypothetical protein
MMLDYMFGHANWMNELSDQEYWNRPRFGQEFTEAVCLNRRKMTGSFERFDGSEEAMDHYFDVTRGRAQAREQEIRADFAAGGASLDITLGKTLMRRRTPTHGFRRTRCRIEWTTDGPPFVIFLFLFRNFGYVLLILCSNNFICFG